MSKIEEALKKARSLEGAAPAGSPFQAPRTEPQGPAQIRRMGEEPRRAPTDLAARRIIHAEMADKAVLDAFRALRTTVIHRTGGRGAVIMVAATAQDGGGSFVSLNLGAAIALDEGLTALVIDCNFRQPSLHTLVDPTLPGLADFLVNEEVTADRVIHRCGIPRLRVIPAGQRAGERTEYFTLARLKQLVSNLRNRYPDRFIIIDAPPLVEAADVRVLQELCDQVLLVVPYGKNTEEEVDRALETIPQPKLLGAVFNDEPRIGAGMD